ncbi:MAG: hypothetical protein V2A76_17550 [Planctomycetota bacterium]
MRRILLIIAMTFPAGCSSTPDPLAVEGITLSEDEIFRQADYPGVGPLKVYEVARQILRVHFAGGAFIESPETLTLEVPPRGFHGAPRRVQVFLRVVAVEGGSRAEIFCMIEELRDDLLERADEPWVFLGRDAELENLILHEIWDAVMVAPLPGG